MAARKQGTAEKAKQVEELIEEGRWVDARRLIEAMLRDRPDDHWLLARLATTFYEMGDYEKALDLADRAVEIAPNCPLVLWDRAGALDMLGREREALPIYAGLVRRGLEVLMRDHGLASIAEDECFEGEEWMISLMTDCVYRIACVMEDLGAGKKAAPLYRAFLRMMDLGAPSIYTREEAAARLQKLTPKKARRAELRQALEAAQQLVEG
jgi:tetratricopeptide (TPR) repeat protein